MIKVLTPPKELRISSTSGHVINLPASSEAFVPDSILQEALARGCALADQKGDFKKLEEAKPVYGKESLDRKRLNVVEKTIRLMLEDREDHPNEWTNSGVPDAKAIGRRAKVKVTREIRDKVWNERFGNSQQNTD